MYTSMYTLCILGFPPSFQGCRIFQGLPPGCAGRRDQRDRQWSLLHGCLELVEVAILLPLRKCGDFIAVLSPMEVTIKTKNET